MMQWLYKSKGWTIIILCGMLSLGMRVHHLNQEFSGYHSWRQTQTQTTVLNFAFEDADILTPHTNTIRNGTTIERMEFPLMQWLFSWAYRWLGDQPIYSRLLTFLIGLGTLLAFYHLVLICSGNRTVAAIAAWSLTFSPLFYYYSINPLPDNMALMCSMIGLWVLVDGPLSMKRLLVAGMFLSLAAAVKLPFVVFAPALLPMLWKLARQKGAMGAATTVLLGLIFLPALAWYAWVIPTWGSNPVLAGDIGIRSDTWDILHTVWTMMLPEMILNYAAVPFFLIGIVAFFKLRIHANPKVLPLLIPVPFVLAYYLFELHAIGKAHDYYLFPFVPILFLAVALGVHYLVEQGGRWTRWVWLPVVVLPITCFLKADVRWEPTGLNRQLWAHKEALRSIISETDRCIVGNDISERIFLYHLRRKGWAFMDDSLPADRLQACLDEGATYIISTSRKLEADHALQPYLGEAVYVSDEVRAYRIHQKRTD
jgi:hypothetical protein